MMKPTTSSVVLSGRQGTENLGNQYELRVIVYLAAIFDAYFGEDFDIITTAHGLLIFDDIIVKCSHKGSDKKHGYFFQVKHSGKILLLTKAKKTNAPKYACINMQDATIDINKVRTNSIRTPEIQEKEFHKFIENIDEYFFYIFTNTAKVETEIGVIEKCDETECNPLAMLANADTYKCKIPNNDYQNVLIMNNQVDFHNIITNIRSALGSKFTYKMIDDLIVDIGNYMKDGESRNVMNRHTFQSMCLEKLVSTALCVNIPSKQKMSENFHELWQEIFKEHNIVVIENKENLLSLLCDYYERKIQKYDTTFTWSQCSENQFELSDTTIQTFRSQVKITRNQRLKSLKDLLILMWFIENWPLILHIKQVNKCLLIDAMICYKHLNKKFIVLMDEPESSSFLNKMNVFQNVSDIQTKIIREQINKIPVSLQGRLPVPMINIVGDNETIWNAVTASHLLQWSEDNFNPVIGNHLKERKTDYISRHFRKGSTTYSEEEVIEDLTRRFHFTVINNDTGMGKSTALHSLSLRYEPKNVSAFINLADLKDLRTWKKQWKTPYDYFCHKIQITKDSLFEAIFKAHQSSNRLCLFLDSFEEVLAAHEQHILEILDDIVTEKTVGLIMTSTRPAKRQLKNYSVTYIKLTEFNQEEINNYCLRNNVRLDVISNHQILTNALHLSILPIVYETIKQKSHWNATDLYREFIGVQLSNYINKNAILNNDDGTLGNSIRRDLLDVYRKLSLVSAFRNSKLEELDVLKTDELDNLKSKLLTYTNAVGVISDIDDRGVATFAHNVYGHYLRAEWFYQNRGSERFSELYVMLLESPLLYDTVHLLNMMANSKQNKAIVAIMNANHDVVSKLIREKDDSLLKPDDLGRYPLHIAAWYSKNSESRKTVKELHSFILERNNQILTRPDNFNLTWINYMQAGTMDIHLPQKIKRLIHDGADVNRIFVGYGNNLFDKKIFPTDMAVLHYAISYTTCEFVKYLLDHGADRYEMYDGQNALNIAISDGHSIEILKLLLTYDANGEVTKKFLHSEECMYSLLFSKSLFAYAFYEILTECGMDPRKITDDQGRNFLHHAVSCPLDDAYKIVKSLLTTYEMNISETDLDGNDVTYYSILASSENIGETLQLLLEKGMDIHKVDKSGMNYFHHVVLSESPNSYKIVKSLLDMECDPKIKDNQGRDSLHLSALSNSRNSYKSVELLLSCRDGNTLLTHRDKTNKNSLHFAVLSSSENAHKTVELLLDYNVSPEQVDNVGRNPLHYATLSQSENVYKVVQLILRQKVDPNISDKEGKTCLHYKEFFESKYAVRILELLLDSQLNPNSFDNDKRTCLYYDYLYRSECAIKLVELLLNYGLDPNIPDKNGQICLHNNRLYDLPNTSQVIELLLKWNLDPNHADNNGKTCLHNEQIYYMENSCKAVEMLLKSKYNHRMDPNLLDNDGKNCLHYEKLFYSDNARKMIALLLENGLDATKPDRNGNNCLHYEVIHYSENARKMVELLLEYGLNPNHTNDEGQICLHNENLYYSKNALETIKLLLTKGLNPNTLDASGKNCLHYNKLFLSENARDVFDLLLKNPNLPLNPNTRDPDGKHCLQYALEVDNEDVYKMVDLLCQYLDFTQSDCNGGTYLHDIASSSSETAYKLLPIILKYDNNPNRADVFGRTALHYASLSSSVNSYKMVEILLSQPQVDVATTDKEGNTVLHLACSSLSENVSKTVKILLQHNVDVAQRNFMGKTCLHIAAASSSFKAYKVIKGLLECNVSPSDLDGNGKDCYYYVSLSKSPTAFKIRAVLDDYERNNAL